MKRNLNKKNKSLALFNKHVYLTRVTEKNDRLKSLIDECDSNIRKAEVELARLKSERAHLLSFASRADSLASGKPEKNKYASMGPTDAILDAVKSLWKIKNCNKRGVRSFQVKDYILANGYVPGAIQFEIAVNVTLRRLAESGRIYSERVGPDRFYRPIDE